MRPLLVPLSLIPASCVVTSTPTFQEQEDCPPSFLTNQAVPATDVPFHAELPTSTTTSGTGFDFDGKVPLRSCALAKDYKGRVFVDDRLYVEINIQANGEPVREATRVVVPLSALSLGCHKIQLLASTAFAPDTTFRTPVKQDDIAITTWQVIVDGPGTPGGGCL